ncbi:MBL fold metallo-hydrolase [Prevotella jejuni]|uniref:MBL fold metallo-hydrolase n=1 Tax=Prevotella jejuni TaxID=1177574 RepID=UPI00352CD13F
MKREEDIRSEHSVRLSPPSEGLGEVLTFLGTGTSNGVPVLGCNCAVCRSKDPRDNRLRTSALLETATTRIVIDSGPDFRQQMLAQTFRKIDGLLITHIHYDHVGGIDDVRPFCALGDIDVYANATTCEGLRHNFPYCFTDHLYPGVPKLNLHSILPHAKFVIGDIEVTPITVMHGKLPILGYRFGKLAYITDMKTIDDAELPYLEGVETLVVNALRWEHTHHSHQLIADAIAFSRKIGAKRTYLTHLTHRIGLHEEAQKQLPKNVFFAYDGLSVGVRC